MRREWDLLLEFGRVVKRSEKAKCISWCPFESQLECALDILMRSLTTMRAQVDRQTTPLRSIHTVMIVLWFRRRWCFIRRTVNYLRLQSRGFRLSFAIARVDKPPNWKNSWHRIPSRHCSGRQGWWRTEDRLNDYSIYGLQKATSKSGNLSSVH